ncbi:hypothetical protein D3C84_1210620 [compost metagenome]
MGIVPRPERSVRPVVYVDVGAAGVEPAVVYAHVLDVGANASNGRVAHFEVDPVDVEAVHDAFEQDAVFTGLER